MKYETACGIISGGAVAPLVSIVDEAIFSNASKKATVLNSLKQSFMKLFNHPVSFVRSPAFLWIWAVYGATYVVSNCVERQLIQSNASQVASHPQKFLATSSTNILMSVLKDRAFTKMFGTHHSTPRSIPMTSMACYTARDAMTIAASFTLVEPVGVSISERFGIDRYTSTLIAQIFCPLIAQTLNTPLMLYGMNLYNNPENSKKQHFEFINQQYWKTLACRIARIAPAYSIGGVLNTVMRKRSEKWRRSE